MPILLPESQDQNDEEELKYPATDTDEECFFLMYFMHMQPTEAYKLTTDHRKWILARFMAQKQMERSMLEQQRIASSLDLGNLKNFGT